MNPNDKDPHPNKGKMTTTQNQRSVDHIVHHNEQARRYLQESEMAGEFGTILAEEVGKLDRLTILKEEQEFARKFFQSAGFLEGTTAAVVAFVCLNRVPRYWARHVARREQQQQQPYVLEKQKTSVLQQKQQSPFQTPDQAQLEKQVFRSRIRFLFSAFELAFDISMSLGVGIGVSFLASDQKEVVKSITEIPLQPGRSLLAGRAQPSSTSFGVNGICSNNSHQTK
jgi:hypothetical protein